MFSISSDGFEPFDFGFDNGVTYLKFTVSLLSCRQSYLTNINVDVKSRVICHPLYGETLHSPNAANMIKMVAIQAVIRITVSNLPPTR